jgi:hypothetical protein
MRIVCVLGVTCNKPIRVSSPIPFKSQLRLCHGGFAIYMGEFVSENAKAFCTLKIFYYRQEIKLTNVLALCLISVTVLLILNYYIESTLQVFR